MERILHILEQIMLGIGLGMGLYIIVEASSALLLTNPY